MADHEALEVLVGASPLPVGLLDLAAFVLTAVSESAAEILGAPADELVGRDVLSLTDEVDATRTALEAVASGVIDAYEASRRFRRGDGTTVATTLWVRDLSRDGYVDTALFLWRADHDRIVSQLISEAGRSGAGCEMSLCTMIRSCSPATDSTRGRCLVIEGFRTEQRESSLVDAARPASPGAEQCWAFFGGAWLRFVVHRVDGGGKEVHFGG